MTLTNLKICETIRITENFKIFSERRWAKSNNTCKSGISLRPSNQRKINEGNI